MRRQTTIAKEVQVSGHGLHTGTHSNVKLFPAEANTGIRFRKEVDDNQFIMPADVSLVRFSDRCTVLENDHFKVMTVEHLLSALAGLSVHNVWIEIDGEELPILDGSALPWVRAIQEAGVVSLDQDVEAIEVQESLTYFDEETGATYNYVPGDSLEMAVAIDFNSQVVAPQYASWCQAHDDYAIEIAPCRTFVFLHDVMPLLQYGLIKGGSLDNAVLITENEINEPSAQDLLNQFPDQNKDLLKPGVHAKGGLRYNNELARHKLLDLIGDLVLVNRPLTGKIFAVKPSHKANAAFAKVLKKHLQEQSRMVFYNPNKAPVCTTEEVADMLPHRYPFLLVDKIIHLDLQKVVGVKNVTFTESFFQGHFPGNPVMPGVLQIEALAQVGGVLAMKHMPEDQKFDTYFLKIDNAKFKRKVVPGDTLLLRMQLMEPIRRGICKMLGTAFVGNSIVAEAELTAQLVARK